MFSISRNLKYIIPHTPTCFGTVLLPDVSKNLSPFDTLELPDENNNKWKFYEEKNWETPQFEYSQTTSQTTSETYSLSLGRKVAGSCAVLGIAATIFENMSINDDERDSMGPHARDLFRKTYMYSLLGTGVGFVTAYGIIRTGLLGKYISLFNSSPLLGVAVTLVPSLTSLMVMKQTNDPIIKTIAATSLYASIGFSASPLIFIGIPALTEAAILTSGIFGSFSIAAFLSPNDSFMNWGAPLITGLTVVALASFIPIFIRRPGTGTNMMHKISMYGGLTVFSGLLLYDTKRIQKKCIMSEDLPYEEGYQPIDGSVSIFLDIYNIFIRLAMIANKSK